MASGEDQDFILIQLPVSAARHIFGTPALLEKQLGILRRWSEREARAFADLLSPPVPSAARSFWFHAKLIELFSLHLFEQQRSEPTFCGAAQQGSHRHVRRALEILDARASEPLDLGALASEVGCAPHYLSRLVRRETGKTLSLHLRSFRIEQASTLLAQREMNVTEVALEVGYTSLSHFSKAFSDVKGLTPSAFLRRGT